MKKKHFENHILFFSETILNDPRLKARDRLLIALMAAYDGVDGCYASNARLARFVNCSVGTISKSINELHDFGYITFNGENQQHGGRGYVRRVLRSLKRRSVQRK